MGNITENIFVYKRNTNIPKYIKYGYKVVENKLKQSYLIGPNILLNDIDLENVNLSSVDLSNSLIKNSSFKNCIMKDVITDNCVFDQTTILGPVISNSFKQLYIDNISGNYILNKNMRLRNLSNSSFYALDLTDFDFSESNLTNVVLSETKLNNTIFDRTYISSSTTIELNNLVEYNKINFKYAVWASYQKI